MGNAAGRQRQCTHAYHSPPHDTAAQHAMHVSGACHQHTCVHARHDTLSLFSPTTHLTSPKTQHTHNLQTHTNTQVDPPISPTTPVCLTSRPCSLSVSASSTAVFHCWSRMAASAARSWRVRSEASPCASRNCLCEMNVCVRMGPKCVRERERAVRVTSGVLGDGRKAQPLEHKTPLPLPPLTQTLTSACRRRVWSSASSSWSACTLARE